MKFLPFLGIILLLSSCEKNVSVRSTFTQPKFSFSITATLKPNCEALIAVTYPPGPLPKTIISYFIFIYDLNCYGNKFEKAGIIFSYKLKNLLQIYELIFHLVKLNLI